MDRNDDLFLSSLQNIATQSGYETRSYSGRGMNGKECLAVFLPEGKYFRTLVADMLENTAALVTSGLNGEEADFFHDSMGSLVEGLREMKTDDMGRGTVAYFPSLQYVPADTEEETPDSE